MAHVPRPFHPGTHQPTTAEDEEISPANFTADTFHPSTSVTKLPFLSRAIVAACRTIHALLHMPPWCHCLIMEVLSETIFHGFLEFLLVFLGVSRMSGLECSLPGSFLRVVFVESYLERRCNVCFRDRDQAFLLLAVKAVDYAKSDFLGSKKNLLHVYHLSGPLYIMGLGGMGKKHKYADAHAVCVVMSNKVLCL